MSTYDKCRKCGRFDFLAMHLCPPIFNVWCPEDNETEDDARAIHATDAEEAAELWAEYDDCDSAEYRIVGGVSVEVCVKDQDGIVTRWVVSGESVPSYSASGVI